MTALRKLIFGETRLLPAGVFVLVAAAIALEEVAGTWWHDAGGFVLLTAVGILLAASVRTSARRRPRPARARRFRAR